MERVPPNRREKPSSLLTRPHHWLESSLWREFNGGNGIAVDDVIADSGRKCRGEVAVTLRTVADSPHHRAVVGAIAQCSAVSAPQLRLPRTAGPGTSRCGLGRRHACSLAGMPCRRARPEGSRRVAANGWFETASGCSLRATPVLLVSCRTCGCVGGGARAHPWEGR